MEKLAMDKLRKFVIYGQISFITLGPGPDNHRKLLIYKHIYSYPVTILISIHKKRVLVQNKLN
jgi:hypothetical protein